MSGRRQTLSVEQRQWLADHNSGVLWMYLMPGLTEDVLLRAAKVVGVQPNDKPRQVGAEQMRAWKRECKRMIEGGE